MKNLLLLAVLVSLPLLLGGCNQSSSVLSYEIHGDNVTITGCDKDAFGELVIPDTIKGRPVTAIGQGAFAGVGYYEPTFGDTEHPSSDNPTLESIVIPNSITSIGRFAFINCVGLTNISIPDSVTRIGERAFEGCANLTAVTFLGDAPKVENNAFKYSSSIIYRKPEAKGWGDTFGDRPVKLIGEAPSEKPIADTAQAKSGKKFPSSTKELMFGSNPVVTDKDKAFWEAAKSGNLEVVQRLLSEGVDVDIYGSTVGVDFGCTALFWAAKHNHKEVAQFLLDKEAYIDAGAGMGGSPLHRAAYEGHSEIVELLISEGANAEAKTGDGKTVLDFANEEIARLIRKSIDEKKQQQNNP